MANAIPCRVVQLGPSDLVELQEQLKPGLPRTSGLRASARNVLEGRVEGNFYTDGWPEFMTIVFQCLQPRLSNVCDLHCYTTVKQHLLQVLEQAHLVTAGQWQLLQVIENREGMAVTNYLVKNLRPDGEKVLRSEDYSVMELGMYALLGELPTARAKCPVGYSLGELRPKHNVHVSSQVDQWINSIGMSQSWVEEFCKQCIQRLFSAAVFCDSDPTTPVAWQMQYGFSGELGNLFTVEGHRRKGLATAVKIAVCRKILASGDIPISMVLDNSPNKSLHLKLGFSHVCRVVEVYLYSTA